MSGERGGSALDQREGGGERAAPYPSEEELAALEYLEVPRPKRGPLHEVILEDPISQLNIPMPVVLDADDPVSVAARFMTRFRYGSVLVTEDEALAGIFTERDLLLRCAGKDLDRIPLRDVMTRDPRTLTEEDTIAHALHLMAVGGYRHIPVLRNGLAAGFASVRGILRYLTENAIAPPRCG